MTKSSDATVASAQAQGQDSPAGEASHPGSAELARARSIPTSIRSTSGLDEAGRRDLFPISVGLATQSGHAPAPVESAPPAGRAQAVPSTAWPALEDFIMRQVVHIREVRANSMAVLLKPISGTELTLHLRQHEGRLEIHARCERGDLTQMESEWGRLQSALALHGVRLAPLNEPPPATQDLASRNSTLPREAHSGPLTDQERRSPSHRSPAPEPEDLPMVGSLTEPLKRTGRGLAPARRTLAGWETWA
ncbi:MAG: hypothetical protein FJ387_09540 [Verrucomicrobia bacterium]|nr:hypothetical protein [Verrucomicrobiota bacterium]